LAELFRLVMELNQIRRAYLELHQEHQYRTLKKELPLLEDVCSRQRPLTQEIRIRLTNLRSNL
jgi:hypothetical protein